MGNKMNVNTKMHITHRKVPNISPGLKELQIHFWWDDIGGLHSEGLLG